jgi:hypothetical protein
LVYLTGGLAVAHFDYSNTVTDARRDRHGLELQRGKDHPGGRRGECRHREGDLHGFRLAYLLRGTGLDDTIRLHDNIARVGINYRFLP